MAKTQLTETASAAQPSIGPAQAGPHIHIDDSSAQATYANFYRITGAPEEVLLDFGLNAEPIGPPRGPIRVNQRIVMNYHTAKRLLASLAMTIKRHEELFGVLETDIQKRMSTARGQTAKE